MVRPRCENSSELTKGPWSKQEDEKLIDYIKKHGHENWRVLPKRAGLNRCGKSCRLRWINYLNPNIKRGDFSDEEEQIIIKLHSQLGNKWSRIAGHLRGRTDNEIKNYWNTRMRKKLLTIGVDPKTHQPLLNPNLLSNLFLLNLIAPPSWNNAFYHTNNPQQFTQNLKPMLNQNVFDSINQLQLSQSLTEMSSLNSFPITNYSQQEPFHDINNVVKNIEYVNTLPSLPMHMASFDCEFQTKLDKICHNNYPNIDYIPENETSLPNLVSVETPNIVNQVESSIYSVGSPSSIMVEDWDTFWDNEANVIQWPENL